ncbi:ABC transporter ATP-binding protein [Croceiramulus getboli]|nr:ABC transporter ATP-binding protein [Flavobacteriaceae bacterium YJPT1-3]
MKSVLRTKNINKFFESPKRFQVLKDVSFSIAPGEFASIMGKSGCGKSTLLYILSTLDTDYTGELYFNEELITGKRADELARIRNQSIGFVFQFHYLLAEFTALENVMLPARKRAQYSEEEIEHRAMEKLKALHIHDLALKKAYQLSGGEKQRVAIARALINDPAILMGDEPTGNLDSYNSENVFQIFRELSATQKLSLLVVTHDLDFAEKTDRIIEMSDGQILKT